MHMPLKSGCRLLGCGDRWVEIVCGVCMEIQRQSGNLGDIKHTKFMDPCMMAVLSLATYGSFLGETTKREGARRWP